MGRLLSGRPRAGAANPTQGDQDANGVGDRCDPNTYDFAADTIGPRPLEMTQTGSGVPVAMFFEVPVP